MEKEVFLILGSLNENIPWNWSLLTQGLIGTAIITSLEFLFGYILNIQLQLNIWDYSHLPFNYKGQICLSFSCLWFILGLIGIILDDFLRWKIFDEENTKEIFKDILLKRGFTFNAVANV